jgi:hypothetical protein
MDPTRTCSGRQRVRDVITDGRWRGDAALQAEDAQRRMQKLKLADPPCSPHGLVIVL